MASDLGIVIPVFQPDIEQLAAYVHALDDQLTPETIHIELDAPQSGIPEALSKLPASINTVKHRRGKGAAITAGFETLNTDLLAFVDADGSTLIDAFANVVAPVQEGQADLAIGSRRHPEAEVIIHQTFVRQHFGNVFARLARQLLSPSLYDYQCGAKVISANAWSDIRGHLYESGFAWDIELIAIAVALNKRIIEVPIEWVDHPSSTVSPIRDSLKMFRGLLMARHRAELVRGNWLHQLLDRPRRRVALIDQISGDSVGSKSV